MKKLKMAVFGIALFASCVSSAFDASFIGRPQVRPLATEDGRIFCSAVMLRPGAALTASHCVDGAVHLGGQLGVILGRGDDNLDYALLSFPSAVCPCARLADYEAEVDEPVYVIGYPRGMAQVVTLGTSQGVVDGPAMPYGRRLIVTAPVLGGNSGGGVFVSRNGELHLVGLLVEAIGHLSFAVPLADLRPFLEKHEPKA